LAANLAGQPPAYVVTCGFDPLRDEGRAYAERLRAAGVAVEHREWPGQIHAFTVLTEAIPEGESCIAEIARWLKRTLAA
jgi:acetyl esterase